MKITDVFMISSAIVAYFHEGILSNVILACVTVYFIARFGKCLYDMTR